MTKQTVAILGASQNRDKYGNKAVRAHLDLGYDVYPVNPKADEIEGVKAYPTLSDLLDAVAIVWPPDGDPEVRHYEDAFESPW